MVDNRAAGFFGIGGAFNFKSGDISGTAAKTQDDKMGQGTEYYAQGQNEEEQNQYEFPFVDRSAQLRATLNSLAMMNVANVLNSKKRTTFLEEMEEFDEEKEYEENEEFMDDFDENEEKEQDQEYY